MLESKTRAVLLCKIESSGYVEYTKGNLFNCLDILKWRTPASLF